MVARVTIAPFMDFQSNMRLYCEEVTSTLLKGHMNGEKALCLQSYSKEDRNVSDPVQRSDTNFKKPFPPRFKLVCPILQPETLTCSFAPAVSCLTIKGVTHTHKARSLLAVRHLILVMKIQYTSYLGEYAKWVVSSWEPGLLTLPVKCRRSGLHVGWISGSCAHRQSLLYMQQTLLICKFATFHIICTFVVHYAKTFQRLQGHLRPAWPI